MSAALINSFLQTAAHSKVAAVTTGPLVDRTHFSSSGGGGGYHQSSHEGKGGKHSIALSALTLLAFLFFLNILQNCIQEHMDSMNPQMVMMTATLKAREAEKRKGNDPLSNITSLSDNTELMEAKDGELQLQNNGNKQYAIKKTQNYEEENTKYVKLLSKIN